MAMDMKRLWVFLAVCWIALSLGAYPYKVNVSSSLNMRSEPSVKSEILVKLQNGDIVDCPLAASELQGRLGASELPGHYGLSESTIPRAGRKSLAEE